LRLLGEVGTYSVDVEIDDGLLAFEAEEEVAVGEPAVAPAGTRSEASRPHAWRAETMRPIAT